MKQIYPQFSLAEISFHAFAYPILPSMSADYLLDTHEVPISPLP